jgi:hypothetical protein
MRRLLVVACLVCARAFAGDPAEAGTRGSLRVEVRSAASGAPIGGARVEIEGRDAAAGTDAGGVARLSGLPTGTTVVRESASDYRPVDVSVGIGPAEAIVEVALTPVELRVDESVIVSAARADCAASTVPRSTVVVARAATWEAMRPPRDLPPMNSGSAPLAGSAAARASTAR